MTPGPVIRRIPVNEEIASRDRLLLTVREAFRPLFRQGLVHVGIPLSARIDLPHRVAAAVLVRALLAIGLGGVFRDELRGGRVVVALGEVVESREAIVAVP